MHLLTWKSLSLVLAFHTNCDLPVDDADTPDTIGVSGMTKYLNDISVSIEDIGMLAVSEIIKSPSMGEMSREGFVDGWSAQGYALGLHVFCNLSADVRLQFRLPG